MANYLYTTDHMSIDYAGYRICCTHAVVFLVQKHIVGTIHFSYLCLMYHYFWANGGVQCAGSGNVLHTYMPKFQRHNYLYALVKFKEFETLVGIFVPTTLLHLLHHTLKTRRR